MPGKRTREDSIGNSARGPRQARTPFRWHGGQESRPRLSAERARQFARTVLLGGGDESARALIMLLVGLAYEPDDLRRDELALSASEEAFTLTEEFSRALDEFATSVGVTQTD